MNRLFGKAKPKAAAPTISDTISNTDSRIGSLEKQISKLDVDIKKYGEQMRKMKPGRSRDLVKQKAMRLLRQKRQYENQLDQMQQQSFNFTQQHMAIQSVKDTQAMVSTMQASKKELQAGMKKINIDQVEDLQDEMEDLMEDTNEIQEILGRAYGTPEDIDDADLEAELDMLGEMDMSDMGDILGDTLPDAGQDMLVQPVPKNELVPQPAAQNNVAVDEFGLAEL